MSLDMVAELLQKYLNQVLVDPEHAFLEIDKLPTELQEFGESLTTFTGHVAEAGTLAKALAKGNLSAPLPPTSNKIADPLKSLHATLKHLTWQAQQIAKGDYQQHIDFMGDFSQAFNTMIEQLEQRRLTLLSQIQSMAQTKSLYEMLAGQIKQRIIVTDAQSAQILYATLECDGSEINDDCLPHLSQWLQEQTKSMAGKSEGLTTELELVCNGVPRHFAVSVQPLLWHEHNALSFVLTDISAEREQLKRLQSIASIDTLTQLYNRCYGMSVLEQWLAENRSFILVFADIDNLKFVNDQYGHVEGDQYIRCVSAALKQFSPHAMVCRIGGDEFILLEEKGDPEQAAARMEALRAEMIEASGFYECSISYGVIPVFSDSCINACDLINAADEKMYEYKRAYKLRQIKRRPVKDGK